VIVSKKLLRAKHGGGSTNTQSQKSETPKGLKIKF
jgi:hypothetical protein